MRKACWPVWPPAPLTNTRRGAPTSAESAERTIEATRASIACLSVSVATRGTLGEDFGRESSLFSCFFLLFYSERFVRPLVREVGGGAEGAAEGGGAMSQRGPARPVAQPTRLKIISMGDERVGKSCLIKRFCEEKFGDKHVRARALRGAAKPAPAASVSRVAHACTQRTCVPSRAGSGGSASATRSWWDAPLAVRLTRRPPLPVAAQPG